jgi:hypothetical protein
MAYGVADVIHQGENFQQKSLLARAPAKIVGNGSHEVLAPRAQGLQQVSQSADSALRIEGLMRKSRALCGQRGGQLRLRNAGADGARKSGL